MDKNRSQFSGVAGTCSNEPGQWYGWRWRWWRWWQHNNARTDSGHYNICTGPGNVCTNAVADFCANGDTH
jgi:hypothetical protein